MEGQIASLATVASLSVSVAVVWSSRCVRTSPLLGGLSAASSGTAAGCVKTFEQTASGFGRVAFAEARRP